jgi:hypothetical protein
MRARVLAHAARERTASVPVYFFFFFFLEERKKERMARAGRLAPACGEWSGAAAARGVRSSTSPFGLDNRKEGGSERTERTGGRQTDTPHRVFLTVFIYQISELFFAG